MLSAHIKPKACLVDGFQRSEVLDDAELEDGDD